MLLLYDGCSPQVSAFKCRQAFFVEPRIVEDGDGKYANIRSHLSYTVLTEMTAEGLEPESATRGAINLN